ncbi:hypothetical protein LTS18_000136, partial [Coniosporium uncinatum]
MSNPNGIANSLALTPLTNTESSPTGKLGSPRSLKRTHEQMQSGIASPYGAPTEAAPETMTPVQTPPETQAQARPGPEQSKGTKLVFDPALATDKEGKKAKPKYKSFGLGSEPSAPPDPRLAIAGYEAGMYHRPGGVIKNRLRIAPYQAKPFQHDSKTSCGAGPATQVCVTGYDPFTPDAQLRTLLSSYGEIAEFSNKTDPNTGSFVGVCLARYKENTMSRSPTTAAQAARKAEKEGTGQRVGVNIVTIERDRE